MNIAVAILALTLPLLAACSEHSAMTQQKSTTSKYEAPYSLASPAVQQKQTTTTTTVHSAE